MLREGIYIADRYEIVGKVGSGGMSDVYKAMDHSLSRYVAIKVLKQEFSEDVNFVTKFRSEAQAAGGLEHPNIVNIYDVGSQNGLHYIVMEFVEGITLKTYIEKKGQLSFKEAVSIAIQVSMGIRAAHNKLIIHRDIKPQNIIISTEGKVKVTDFGIARATSSNTINAEVMGSVHYASPEQARNGYVDAKSDIYSLGIVMYEMVTGRVPFDGDTAVAVAIQHLQEKMVSPSVYAPGLPISMEKIILKCTQKSADRRYETVDDLIADLKQSLLTPNEDFVTMVPLNDQQETRVIGEDEVKQIKKEASKIVLEEDEDEEEEELEEDEEDDDEFLNPKVEKLVTIAGISVIVILVCMVIYFVGVALNLFGGIGSSSKSDTETESGQVAMIDIVGMDYDDAKDALSELGLGIKTSATESSEKYAENEIISQDVEEGDQVAANTTIKVVVSTGSEEEEEEEDTATVLNVTGKDEDTACNLLENAGFTTKVTYDYNDDIEAGMVISTDPEAGEKVSTSKVITVTVSRGESQVTVPDVTGKKEAKAKAALSDAGFKCTVTTEYDDNVKEGFVIEQSVKGKEKADKGSTITITVSLGAKTETYSYSGTVDAPSGNYDSVSAHIELTTAQGDVVYTNTVTSFPATVSASGIENSAKGTLTITWTYTTVDAEGNTSTSAPSTEQRSVKFTKD